MSLVFDNYDFNGWQSTNKGLLEKDSEQYAPPVLDQLGFLVQWKNYERTCKPQLKELMLMQFPALKNADKSFIPVMDEISGGNIFEYFKYMFAILLWSEAGQHPTDECPEFYEYGKRQELHILHTPVSPHHLSEWMAAYPREEWEKLCRDENKRRAQNDTYTLDIYHGYINIAQDELIKQFPQILNISQDWWYVYKFITIREAWRWKDKLEQVEFFVTNGLSAEWMKHSPEAAQEEISRRKKIDSTGLEAETKQKV